MLESWKFISATSDKPAEWWWVKCSHRAVVVHSSHRFATFPACLLDAGSHGFKPSEQFEVFRDRRRLPRLAA